MHTTRITRTVALAGFAPAGKLSHTYCGLLPALALLVATPVWSQTTSRPSAPHRPSSFSMAASSAKPAADTPASAHYKFLTIGPEDSPYVVADGINNEGLVTGYYEDLSSVLHGFVWQDGFFKTVDYPGAAYTYLFGVNNRGLAIGYYGDGTTNHTVTYAVRTGTSTALPDIPGYAENDGYCINDLGVAVGGAFEGSTSVGWLWDPTTLSYSFLAVPGAAQNSTSPSCLNDKNQVAGYYADASGAYHGFIYEYGAYTIVNMPGAEDTYPDGINNRGIIQGQIFDAAGVAEGFVATSGGVFTAVNFPGPEMTAVVGINDRADLCGTYWASWSGPFKAFVAILQ